MSLQDDLGAQQDHWSQRRLALSVCREVAGFPEPLARRGSVLSLVVTIPMISQKTSIQKAVTWLMGELWYCFVLVVLIGIALAVGIPSMKFVLRRLDSARLERLAHRIASADRIEASAFHRPVDVSVSVGGEEARRVVSAVSSSKRDRNSYANIWGVKVLFLRGTNVLAEVKSSGDLFLVDGNQYRDDTGLLREMVVKPAYDVPYRAWEKQRIDQAATNKALHATAAAPGS